jgi:hypothetical protein|tara:strand:- start:334 stop:507 length:174 start_codon:yes stop_codon:yes gene_type:complete
MTELDFTYDELYDMKLLLKKNLRVDKTLTEEDKDLQTKLLNKCLFKMKVLTELEKTN